MLVNPLDFWGRTGYKQSMHTAQTPPGIRRNLKKARSEPEGQCRLWDCPVSGGPFCPQDEAPWWEDSLPTNVVCPECGYDTTLLS